MPVKPCSKNGKKGFKWGNQGFCYVEGSAESNRRKAARQGQAIKASQTANQERTEVVPSNPLKADPTRTKTLRKQFMAEVNKRFLELKSRIIDLVVKEDAFGLKSRSSGNPLTGNDGASLLTNERWRFNTDSEKLDNFRKWLEEEMRDIIPPTPNADLWWQKFTEEGYRRGAGRAFDDTRKLGGQTNLDFFQGTKQEFLRQSFARPETIEKVKLLSSRVFTELNGVTHAMSQQMTRVLAEGLSRGDNPSVTARRMNKAVDISRKRALTIARTETIRAHAEGQLDSLERLGVQKVGVAVEWSTAEDDRVCPQCQPLNGVVLSIKEARGILPRHPNCRCAFTPANVGEDTKGQKRGTAKIRESMRKSVGAESRKRSIKEQLKRSRWAGADARLKRTRPKSKSPLYKKEKPSTSRTRRKPATPAPA